MEKLPNTDGYREISPEELIVIADHEGAYTLTKAMHYPRIIPAILIDWQDGRKEFYTMETAQKAKSL